MLVWHVLFFFLSVPLKCLRAICPNGLFEHFSMQVRVFTHKDSEIIKLNPELSYLWLRGKVRRSLNTLLFWNYKCRQVLIVILSTFLEVIKCELKHQHIGILYNTHKEGEYLLLNVSLLFLFHILYKAAGCRRKFKSKDLKNRRARESISELKIWGGETPKPMTIDSYLLEAEKKQWNILLKIHNWWSIRPKWGNVLVRHEVTNKHKTKQSSKGKWGKECRCAVWSQELFSHKAPWCMVRCVHCHRRWC